jgi:signal transduction histidine kinase
LLAKAYPAEVAIYWASLLMTEKLNTAFLLIHPEKLLSPNKTVFRLHGMVLKYVKIYNASFVEKGIRLEVTGESFAEIRADSSALGVIPQTFLDNALKYAPRESKVTVEFKEYKDFIILAVTSYGPKIEADEKEKIFELFYRGRNALKEQEEGAGFGLHLAQFVAKSIGSEIVVHQDSLKTRFGYETTFSIRFPREE